MVTSFNLWEVFCRQGSGFTFRQKNTCDAGLKYFSAVHERYTFVCEYWLKFVKSLSSRCNTSTHSVSATTKITELTNSFRFTSVDCYASWQRISAVVEQILPMKSSQLIKLVLMPEHNLSTEFRQLRQRIEFAPTPFLHTQHGNLINAIFDFETSYLQHKTSVFPTFTLSPLSSSPAFEFFNLTFSSSSDSATVTRSPACNSSHGQPVLNSRDKASIRIIKRSGLNTDPRVFLLKR